MDAPLAEDSRVSVFRDWLVGEGGDIHRDVVFQRVPSGFNVIAKAAIPANIAVVSCPFSLAITPALSRRALESIWKSHLLDSWSERQLICTYICVHLIMDNSASLPELAHRPYIDMLPASSQLMTSLHFTPPELECFRGTNLFGATMDRQRSWDAEWRHCVATVAQVDKLTADRYSWELYLTAATYLSSRAFPSTLLSDQPSLITTPESFPVLLPGVDGLNHARAQPISWVVTHPAANETSPQSKISLVPHAPTEAGTELCNNYGPKPNAELILGYGFSLPDNPDDTIRLKIGGSTSITGAGQTWEVGRNANGAGPVWEAIQVAVCAQSANDEEEEDMSANAEAIEEQLWAAEALQEMAEDLLSRLPPIPDYNGVLRAEVRTMLCHYVSGQQDILRSLIAFAKGKEEEALKQAHEQGVEIV